jgi:hypothetical protein
MKARIVRSPFNRKRRVFSTLVAREIIWFVGIIALCAAVWFLRGNADNQIIVAKASQIASLQENIHSNDQIVAQTRAQIGAAEATIDSLGAQVRALQGEASSAQADAENARAALKTAETSVSGALAAMAKSSEATVQSLRDQLQSANQQLADANAKLVQISAGYEAQIANLKARIPAVRDENVIYPGDNGFDAQDVGTGFFSYRCFDDAIPNPTHVEMPPKEPNRTPWVFVKGAGIAANGSGFYVANATNGDSDGKVSQMGQAAFLQFDGSSVRQMVDLPAGTFSVTFGYEARRDYTANRIAVSLDGNVLFLGVPTDTGHFQEVTTESVKLAAGKHELKFLGMGDGDPASFPCTFIDNVRINVVGGHKDKSKPEPLKPPTNPILPIEGTVDNSTKP